MRGTTRNNARFSRPLRSSSAVAPRRLRHQHSARRGRRRNASSRPQPRHAGNGGNSVLQALQAKGGKGGSAAKGKGHGGADNAGVRKDCNYSRETAKAPSPGRPRRPGWGLFSFTRWIAFVPACRRQQGARRAEWSFLPKPRNAADLRPGTEGTRGWRGASRRCRWLAPRRAPVAPGRLRCRPRRSPRRDYGPRQQRIDRIVAFNALCHTDTGRETTVPYSVSMAISVTAARMRSATISA